jgi:hypothetical protein
MPVIGLLLGLCGIVNFSPNAPLRYIPLDFSTNSAFVSTQQIGNLGLTFSNG